MIEGKSRTPWANLIMLSLRLSPFRLEGPDDSFHRTPRVHHAVLARRQRGRSRRGRSSRRCRWSGFSRSTSLAGRMRTS